MEEKCEVCNQEECECKMTPEEIADHADDKVDALIALLIKKGVISEKEYDQEFESLFEKEEEEPSENTE